MVTRSGARPGRPGRTDQGFRGWKPRNQNLNPNGLTAGNVLVIAFLRGVAAQRPDDEPQQAHGRAARGPAPSGAHADPEQSCASWAAAAGWPGKGRLCSELSERGGKPTPYAAARGGPLEKHGGARARRERFPFPPPRTVPRGFPAVRGRPGPVKSKTAELGEQVWGKQAHGPTSWKAPESLSWNGRGSDCLRGRLVFLTRVSAGTDTCARVPGIDTCAHTASSPQPTQTRPLERVLRAEVPEQVVVRPG